MVYLSILQSQPCNVEAKDVKQFLTVRCYINYKNQYHIKSSQDDGVDLLSIKAVGAPKYALNLLNALFTDEELGSSCYKKKPRSKSEKPPLSPKRVALLEG